MYNNIHIIYIFIYFYSFTLHKNLIVKYSYLNLYIKFYLPVIQKIKLSYEDKVNCCTALS